MKDLQSLSIEGIKLSLLIKNEEINVKIKATAKLLKAKYGNDIPIFLCVLNGAFIFAADLIRNYDGNCEISFIRLKSYEGAESSGKVQNIMGLPTNLEGRRVVIVEDIVDTGLTMFHLKELLQEQKPKSIEIAALFTKPSKLKCPVTVDYSCFEIPDKFIVGYGLDYNELYRNLPDVYTK